MLRRDGSRLGNWDGAFHEAHGIAATSDAGEERLWIADPGFRIVIRNGIAHADGDAGQVLEYSLDGRLLRSIRQPPIPYHLIHGAPYKPTSVAVVETRLGGNGDIWIADGYGTYLVHRYDSGGDYRGTISGEEGRAGAFRNPHALLIRYDKGEPELYIADRHNSRIQVYDVAGRFKRAFGQEFLVTPSAFAAHDGLLYVAELRGRVTLLDEDDHFVGYVGENQVAVARDGWPNTRLRDGGLTRPRFRANRFNSPHGVAVDPAGNVYVAEYVIGGRYLRLRPDPTR